jgi:GAF domain-containing protein
MNSSLKLDLESEEKRLRTLASYTLLGEEIDHLGFDDITMLASYITQTPYSFVSFLDKDKQWFKAVNGLSIEDLPINDSICSNLLIEKQSSLVVADLTKEARFAKKAFLKQHPEIKFFEICE